MEDLTVYAEFQEFLRWKKSREGQAGYAAGPESVQSAAELVQEWTELDAQAREAIQKAQALRRQADGVADTLSRSFHIIVGGSGSTESKVSGAGARIPASHPVSRTVDPDDEDYNPEPDELLEIGKAVTELGNSVEYIQRPRGELPGEPLPTEVPEIPDEYKGRIKTSTAVLKTKSTGKKDNEAAFQQSILDAFSSAQKFLQ